MKKIVKKMIKYVSEHKKEISCFVLNLVITLLMFSNIAYAKDPVTGITALGDWFKKLVIAIGGIFVVKNGYEMWTAYQQDDNSGMSRALKGVIGGLGMVGIAWFVKLLGA